MRVLFFTAAAIAAQFASAIKIEKVDESPIYFEDQFPQLNALQETVVPPKPAEKKDEGKKFSTSVS